MGEEADIELKANGTRQRRLEDGTEIPVTIHYEDALRMEPDEKGKYPAELFYVWAITVPRPNTTWDTLPSRVVRSKMFILSVAQRSQRTVASLLLALTIWGCA